MTTLEFMNLGENCDRSELAQSLRSLTFKNLDLSFIFGDGSPNSGYDRYGKYQIRFGWGISLGLTFVSGLWVYMAFFPKHQSDYYDPAAVWTRSNAFWIIPLVLLSWFFVRKSDKKNSSKSLGAMEKALAKNNLVVLVEPMRFFETSSFSSSTGATVPEKAFGRFRANRIDIAFGETFQRWDEIAKPMMNLYGDLGPFPSLFVYVCIPGLEADVVHLSPKSGLDKRTLPKMSEDAFQSLARLASRYAICLGSGAIVVGLAEDTQNDFESSLTGSMATPTGWKICLDILSVEIANIVAGLA